LDIEVTLPQAASRLGLPRYAPHRLALRGLLGPARQVAGGWLLTEQGIASYLDSESAKHAAGIPLPARHSTHPASHVKSRLAASPPDSEPGARTAHGKAIRPKRTPRTECRVEKEADASRRSFPRRADVGATACQTRRDKLATHDLSLRQRLALQEAKALPHNGCRLRQCVATFGGGSVAVAVSPTPMLGVATRRRRKEKPPSRTRLESNGSIGMATGLGAQRHRSVNVASGQRSVRPQLGTSGLLALRVRRRPNIGRRASPPKRGAAKIAVHAHPP
jgi:hypothetical protein